MKSRAALAVLALSIFSLTPLIAATPGAPPPVEIVAASHVISPNSDLGLRFSSAMVAEAQIGKVAAESPLVFKPAVRGHFTWTTDRSGVFAYDEAPPMGAEFVVTLRENLRDAAGKEIGGKLREKFTTPGLELLNGAPESYYSSNDLPLLPKYTLLFNTDVSPEAVAPFLRFADAGGKSVPALVTQTEKRVSYRHNHLNYQAGASGVRPWAQRFLPKNAAQPESVIRNQVQVVPATPLGVGEKWVLLLSPGLPADGQPVKLSAERKLELGNVQPFELSAVTANNVVHSGRSLSVRFSKALAKEVTRENWGQWISIEPTVPELKPLLNGSGMEFTGKFELGKTYTLKVLSGLPAAEPVKLAENISREFHFDPVPARLYFEGFSERQFSSGRRNFQLLAVNVPGAKLQARLIEPEQLPAAIKAWESYDRPYEQVQKKDPDESFQRIDPAKFPGTDLPERDLDTASPAVDATRTVSIPWDTIVGPGKQGAVLLTIVHAATPGAPARLPGAQALVQLTDLGAVHKTSRREHFFHAFSLRSGEPVVGAKFQILDEKSKLIGDAAADASGCARLAKLPDARWLVVTQGDDRFVLNIHDSDDLPLSRYRRDFDDEEMEASDTGGFYAPEMLVHLFTERGVYRPGETVHLKGIARDFSKGTARVPSGRKVELTVRDVKQREVFSREITLSANGSFDADIALPKTTVGYFVARVDELGKAPAGEDEDGPAALAVLGFQVQEFQPNAFEVAVKAPRELDPADGISLPVAAKYYMGKTLSKAQAKWTLRGWDDGFAPEGFGHFIFCNAVRGYRLTQALERESEFSDQGEVELSADGTVTIEAGLKPNPKAVQPRGGRLIVEVTDLNQQTVAAEHTFTMHSSDFYLGIEQFPELLREGDPLPVGLVAVGRDGNPIAPVEATASLSRVDWQTNRVEAAGGAADYQTKPVFTKLSDLRLSTRRAVKDGKKWQLEAGPAGDLRAGAPGLYLLEVAARDPRGRAVATTVSFYVWGKAETVWNYRNPFQVELVADKETYAPGDRARLLVKTPISGPALVTVERENVRRSFVTRLEGNAPSIEVPIEQGDAPNVFVSVMLLRGANDSPKKFKAAEYRYGVARLKVERPDARLAVYVHADNAAYRPADPVAVTVEVLDHKAQPVAGTELTLYAVDEGVLSLTGYELPDLLGVFYRERALQVGTSLTLPGMLEEDPAESQFGNKGFLVGSKGGGKGGDDRVRNNFLACAFWQASAITDAAGKVSVAFNAPDGLTRYKVFAVAHNTRDQFGGGETKFEVNKPFMLEAAPPRFANAGDQLKLRAVLHNTTALDGEAEVRLELDRTAKCAEPVRTVAIKAGASLAVDFPAEIVEPGTASWTWHARFKASDGSVLRDQMLTTLKITYPTPARHAVAFARYDGEAAVMDKVAPELLDGFGTVRVSVSNSRLIGAEQALRELLHYPYGCVEQTTSSLLPWFAAKQIRQSLPSLKVSDEKIAEAAERGINRLLTMQTESGGLAYWPGGTNPEVWATAYGGLGLVTARKAGYAVPEEEFNKAMSWLSAQLRGLDQQKQQRDFSAACLALYTLALADKAEPAYHEMLFKKRAQLSADNRALLALACHAAGGRADMVDALLAFDEKAPAADYWWYGSRERTIALVTLAIIRAGPEAERLEKNMTELFGAATLGSWRTTQGNVWSLLALGEYAEKIERQQPLITGGWQWNGPAQPFRLSADSPTAEITWPLAPGADWTSPRVLNPNRARIYTQTVVESRPRLVEQPAQAQGMRIERTYERVLEDNKLEPLRVAQVGDRVLVTLNVTFDREERYVAIEDPLPSVFEPLLPEFKTNASAAADLAQEPWSVDYRELREDRAQFFLDRVWSRKATIRYLARIRAAGEATAPAARVEAMYEPERFGMTATSRIKTEPLH